MKQTNTIKLKILPAVSFQTVEIKLPYVQGKIDIRTIQKHVESLLSSQCLLYKEQGSKLVNFAKDEKILDDSEVVAKKRVKLLMEFDLKSQTVASLSKKDPLVKNVVGRIHNGLPDFFKSRTNYKDLKIVLNGLELAQDFSLTLTQENFTKDSKFLPTPPEL